MPGSFEGARPEVVEFVSTNIKPNNILDVGPGKGTYADALRPVLSDVYIDGLEIFEPYVDMFDLKSKYDTVHIGNMLEWDDYNYDLVIFGDVMEHVHKLEAIDLWKKVEKQADWAIIACPVIEWIQGAEFGNEHETHLHHYDVEEIHDTFGVPVWEKRVVEVASFIFDLRQK